MKKLATLLLLFVITFTYSQSKVTKDTIYNDSKETVKQVYKDVKSMSPKIEKAITNLANSLKVTADKLWIIIVNQQKVWSWCFLILTISSIINWFLFYKKNFSKNLKYEKVKVLVQKYQYADGTTEKDVINYPNFHGKKYVNVEEEDLKLIPNSQMPYFKYIHLTICIILSAFSFLHFSDMMTGFINPEFGALKTITEVATKLK